ncbi:MAG TPA: hypothetical protein VG944_06640 [Fimbriimonas sp.]|nr:hypothetical protein [Fimbriimonas sp.]
MLRPVILGALFAATLLLGHAGTGRQDKPGIKIAPASRPASPMFADLFDKLNEDDGNLDPTRVFGKGASARREGFSDTAKMIYETIDQELTTNQPLQFQWKENVNPFYWLAKAPGNCSDWWSNYKIQHRSDPTNVIHIDLMVPLVHDFDTSKNPLRVQARNLNNQGVDAYLKGVGSDAAMKLLMQSASTDTSYDLPMFNAALIQGAGQNWQYAINLFASVSDGPRKSSLGAYADKWWGPQLRQYLAVKDDQAARVIPDDLYAALVLCQGGQYRASVKLAAEAAAYARFAGRPHPYLIAALDAACAGLEREAYYFVQRALEHCDDASDVKIVEALFMKLRQPESD